MTVRTIMVSLLFSSDVYSFSSAGSIRHGCHHAHGQENVRYLPYNPTIQNCVVPLEAAPVTACYKKNAELSKKSKCPSGYHHLNDDDWPAQCRLMFPVECSSSVVLKMVIGSWQVLETCPLQHLWRSPLLVWVSLVRSLELPEALIMRSLVP
ncbi:hypothetical protein PsorP6_001315 [Peronosclerospora sorghi]|uniref:Uncharacterized protein n=1 Tax=Peronosclerospora sorghi TaxID=230839 RepID=A0ACC0WVM9_9STRA|nr:hypothetical protein PsorP6_001315 [Peronosclerospora sorghi]